jgi:2-amino-4-hydroxy-6-hydroxymethyldihydropteridine diphosphokinase
MSLYPVTAYIGLGANLGFPVQQLQQALWRLQNSDGVRLTAISNFYRSKALLLPGSPPQPDYINAVARISTSLPPRWLLRRLLYVEQKLGRTRERRWAPRTLDLDLLCYGRQRLRQPDLTLPHAEIHKRAFVLYPLRDIATDLVLPGLGPLQRLLQYCDCSGVTLYRRMY